MEAPEAQVKKATKRETKARNKRLPWYPEGVVIFPLIGNLFIYDR
jgi:hypothetical protein